MDDVITRGTKVCLYEYPVEVSFYNSIRHMTIPAPSEYHSIFGRQGFKIKVKFFGTLIRYFLPCFLCPCN